MKKVHIDLETNQKLFLTSDLHFGHNNVLKFCNRPFADTKEMEKKLIENWNNVVTNEDYVFILGDVFWFNHGSDMKRVFSKLNGKHIYVLNGNHDDFNSYLEKYKQDNVTILDCDEVTLYLKGIHKKEYYLSHCPLMTWPHRDKGVPNFFGHIHSGPLSNNDVDNDLPLWSNQYDVGVDNNNFTPIEVRDILQKINYGQDR